MNFPADRRYTPEGVWALLDGDQATIGISDFSQDAMGDLVYIELPVVGARIKQGDAIGPIESVKTCVEPDAPLSGKVESRNDAASADPEIVNRSPYQEGWLFRLSVADASEMGALLSADDYRRKVE
ncbi:MAG TPA: glycine cleavage system protein GcvH [Dehalococcoidia bacterium]|nr:glycine cleavage system protein GcvH [Dehalococcoidia bacterium]